MNDNPSDSFGSEINRRFESESTKDPSATNTLLQSLLGVILIVVIAGGLVVGAAFLLDRNSGPGHPDEWDERVADLASVVEHTRGLQFDNPVFVEFLADDEFRDAVTNDAEDLSAEDEEDLNYFAGLLRAYGLAEGDIDLFEESNDLYGDRIVGFYDNKTKKLTMRGQELTVEVKLTIVHELTHALQDQHFDLGQIDELAGEESSAFRALAEGDARAVEDEYFETLSEKQQTEYIDSVTAFLDAESASEDAPGPSILSANLSSSYLLGSNFVAALREDDGWRAINRAYDSPPTSMDHLMDPWRYLDEDEIETVVLPEIDGDEESVADDPEAVGPLGWLFILARVIDPVEALDVVDGWGGDIGITYNVGDTSCFVDNLIGDDATATDRFEAAIQSWVDVSSDVRSVERAKGVLTIRGCDPGIEAEAAGEENSEEVLLLPSIRAEVTLGWLDSGADFATAACAGQFIISEVSPELLAAQEFTATQQAEFDATLERMHATCN